MYDEFFQRGGNFAPSFKFDQIGANVAGEILSIDQQDQTDFDDPTKKLYDDRGNVKQQLQVILQTPLRNWQGVAKIPADQETGQPQPPSTDDGRRAIYVKGWMIGAVGDAVEKATGLRAAPQVGGRLAVRFAKTQPPRSGRGQDMKLYEAVYVPPNPSDPMFQQAPQQQPAPPQQQWQQPAPPQQAPQQQWQQPAPPQTPVATFSAQQAQQTGNGWGQQQAPQQPAPQQWQQPAPQQPAPQQAPPADDPWGNFTDTPPF